MGVVKYIHASYGKSRVWLKQSIENRVIQPGERRAITLKLPDDSTRPTYNNLDFSRRLNNGQIIQDCEVFFSIFAKEEV